MDDLDRRTLLKGTVGAAALAAVAGCTENEGQETTTGTANSGGSRQALTPPEPPEAEPENEYWQYVVESLAYQNEMLNRMD